MNRLRTTLLLLCILTFPFVAHNCDRAPGMPAARALHTTGNQKALAVAEAGKQQVDYTFHYDPSYVALDYPGGDVPRDRGVCSDVVVRAFRSVGVDLQRELHEDMQRAFDVYPHLWGLSRPDPNIDHRRVANLMTWFDRRGAALDPERDPERFLPGDVVAWRLNSGRLHIGIVTDSATDSRARYLVVHNIGNGAQIEDVLFAWEIIGHYRYFRDTAQSAPR